MPDDAQVVQIRLDAVIGAAADADFEFVGQGDVMIAQVEALVDLLAQIVSVDQAVLTGRTLAGDDRADQRAVPPVVMPWAAKKSMSGWMFSYLTAGFQRSAGSSARRCRSRICPPRRR